MVSLRRRRLSHSNNVGAGDVDGASKSAYVHGKVGSCDRNRIKVSLMRKQVKWEGDGGKQIKVKEAVVGTHTRT